MCTIVKSTDTHSLRLWITQDRRYLPAVMHGLHGRHVGRITAIVKSMSPFYNKTEIKARGWTDTAITRFLGDPDRITRNRRNKRGKVNLYAKARVEAQESTAAWKEWKQGSEKRSARLKETNARKRDETVRIATEVLQHLHLADEFKGLTRQQLKDRASESFLAIEQRRARHRKNYTPEQITPRRGEKFFDRIIVNWLRHDGTVYDAQLDEYFNLVGVNVAKDMVREQIYRLIAAEYPELADECERQLKLRRNKQRRAGKL